MVGAVAVSDISVFGCGYLGATHAAVLAYHGFRVIGIEPDARKVEILNGGHAPFHEPDLDRLISEGVRNGRLRFTQNHEEARGSQVHFICVGTPQQPDSNAADLAQVASAIEHIATIAQPGDVVVGKSTVPVGTASRCARALSGTEADLVWNPEFLREGFAVADTLLPDRIVVGCEHGRDADHAVQTLRAVYHHQIQSGVPFFVTDTSTAELVKTAANAFLATKISFINAVAEMCELAGADVSALATALGMDDRIGPKFLRAGLGFGGGCLPKDIRALSHRAEELGAAGLPEILRVVDGINLDARKRALHAVRAQAGDRGAVCVLGLSFKPDSDDVRDSPAVALVRALVQSGHPVAVSDPKTDPQVAGRLGATFHTDPVSAAAGAQCIVVATEWGQFREIDPHALAAVVSARRIVDARNCLDPERWRAAGFVYTGIGGRGGGANQIA